jgi:hypothetical protein
MKTSGDGSELQPLQQLIYRQSVVVGDAGQDALQSPDLDGFVVGDYLVMLAADLSGYANM